MNWVIWLSSAVMASPLRKQNRLSSLGTRGDSRGATQLRLDLCRKNKTPPSDNGVMPASLDQGTVQHGLIPLVWITVTLPAQATGLAFALRLREPFGAAVSDGTLTAARSLCRRSARTLSLHSLLYLVSPFISHSI